MNLEITREAFINPVFHILPDLSVCSHIFLASSAEEAITKIQKLKLCEENSC